MDYFFDREDFVQNISDELQGLLNTVITTVPLKKEGHASLNFLLNKKEFSISFDVCSKQSLQVTLFHGVGVDLRSRVIPAFNLQEYSPDTYQSLVDSISNSVKDLAYDLTVTNETIH